MAYEEADLIEDLKRLLADKKVSLRFLSHEIKIPYRSMQNYFSGESRMPAIIFIKILDYFACDIKYLRTGDNLLSHEDLYDTMFKVFGDALIDIMKLKLGERKLTGPAYNKEHREKMEAAYELAVKISEVYDIYTKDNILNRRRLTIKELRQISSARGDADAYPRVNDDNQK